MSHTSNQYHIRKVKHTHKPVIFTRENAPLLVVFAVLFLFLAFRYSEHVIEVGFGAASPILGEALAAMFRRDG